MLRPGEAEALDAWRTIVTAERLQVEGLPDRPRPEDFYASIADRFRGEASPATYLFKVTTSTCLNRLRTRRRRPEDPVEDVSTFTYSDSHLAPLEVRDLVQRLLALGDETTQICVLHHFVDGMTYDEIGEIVGLSAAAVRKRVAKFRSLVQDNPAWLAEDLP